MLIATGFAAHLLSAPARAAEVPDAGECLTRLSRSFAASLPGDVVVRSKVVRADGVTVTHCHYYGNDRRSLLRRAEFRIRQENGQRITSHTTDLVLHGGTWLADEARTGPTVPQTDSLSIWRDITQAENWILPTELKVSLRQRASNDPLPHFGEGSVAFGYIPLGVGQRLWNHGPAAQVTRSAASERVDGVETIVVRIEGPTEIRTLWLDPGHGMLPRQLILESIRTRAGEPSTSDFRQRIHTFQFDGSASPPVIVGFVVETESEGRPRNSMREEFSIDHRPESGAPTDGEFLDAVDLSDGTPVRVDGLGLSSHIWSDGRVVPTRKVAVP